MNGSRTILDCSMRKLPSSRKSYQVKLTLPESGFPIIEYHQMGTFVSSKKPTKSIQFVDLLFADKKHDTSEKWAFSIYSINKTVTFLPQDETIMNEWLTKIRELHSDLYPEFKRYDAIFEANLLEKGLARTMHIQGHYRLALCKDSLDLIPLLTMQDQQQHQQTFKTPATTASATTSNSTAATSTSLSTSSTNNTQHHHHSLHHHHHHNHHPHHPPFEPHISKSNFNHSSSTAASSNSPLIKSHHHHPATHHHHLPQHLPSHQRFCKRHPLLASKTIELVLRSIRRCGHTDSNFYIESGRHSQIGEGDLWMALNKKSTARHLHELLLATMKLASNDDQFFYKGPRSRSGSSSDNAHRQSQSRSSSLVCLAAEITHQNHQQQQQQQQQSQHSQASSTSSSVTTTYNNAATTTNGTSATATTTTTRALNGNSNNDNNNANSTNHHHPAANNILSNLFGTQAVNDLASELKRAAASGISTSPMFLNHDNNKIEQEDSGYLPMA